MKDNMIKTNSYIIIASVVFLSLSPYLIIPSYEHGVGGETMAPVLIGNRNVTLSISETQASPDSTNIDKRITLELVETKSRQPVHDVTYFVKASKDDKELFSHTFQASHGNLLMIISTSPSDEIKFLNQGGGFFDAISGNEQDAYDIIGPIFGNGGLYNFHIEILTADSLTNNLNPPVKYDSAISIPDETKYSIKDNNYGTQNISVITYYDQISVFQYNSSVPSIRFQMPFNWSNSTINQVSVVHEEIHIPRTLVNFLATKYDVYVNNIKLPDRANIIDDYSSDDRIDHIILNRPELVSLAKSNKNSHMMDFVLMPSSQTGFPMAGLTKNGEFNIKLSWEPEQIVSGSHTKFFVDVIDAFSNKTVSKYYEFYIFQNDTLLFNDSGMTDLKNKTMIDARIPSDIEGPISIQFKNLGKNHYANVEFLSSVKISEKLQQFPIKLHSYANNNGTQTTGRYDVDLTWFPSVISTDDQAEFVFTIRDNKTSQPVPQSYYEFVIMQNGQEVYRVPGTTQAGGSFVDYTFFKGQEGNTVLRIEKINNSQEQVEIPISVTPEFPFSPVIVMAIIFSMITIFSKFCNVKH